MKRQIKIDNYYVEDGLNAKPITTHVAVEIRDRLPGESDDDWDEFLRDELFEYTGTGRSGDAGYFAESEDGLEPKINVEWC